MRPGFFFMRANFYIDGFNVYHAVNDLRQDWLKWSCYYQMASGLLLPGHEIRSVKLFTAYATWRPQSFFRHKQYVAAAEASGVEVILGSFKAKNSRCKACGDPFVKHEEKETDVNIAIHLVSDALAGDIDVAYVVTTDSDLAPAVRLVRERTKVQIITVSTPMRSKSKEIFDHCHHSRKIDPALLQKCLMPKQVYDQNGNKVATRPNEYTPPKH
jgi:uncharacterized LabA/DUF88 family protein